MLPLCVLIASYTAKFTVVISTQRVWDIRWMGHVNAVNGRTDSDSR